MGQDKKINPGTFVDKMEILVSTKTQSKTGAVKYEWVPSNYFFAVVSLCESERDQEDKQKLITSKLKFTTWKQNILPTNKILFDGIQYNVDSVNSLQRGLFFEYLCSYKSNSDGTNNNP